MRNTLQKMKALTMQAVKEINAKRAAIVKMETDTEKGFESLVNGQKKINGLLVDIDSIRTAFETEFSRVKTEFLTAKKAELELRGDKMTDDAKLFQGGFLLTNPELKTLAKKYENNATMFRMVTDYIQKNKIAIDIFSLPTLPDYEAALDFFYRPHCYGRVFSSETETPENTEKLLDFGIARTLAKLPNLPEAKK